MRTGVKNLETLYQNKNISFHLQVIQIWIVCVRVSVCSRKRVHSDKEYEIPLNIFNKKNVHFSANRVRGLDEIKHNLISVIKCDCQSQTDHAL